MHAHRFESIEAMPPGVAPRWLSQLGKCIFFVCLVVKVSEIKGHAFLVRGRGLSDNVLKLKASG